MLRLPETILLTILSFCDVISQEDFVRVSSSTLCLWKKIRWVSMDRRTFLRSSIKYQKEIISRVHNPYNQLSLNLDIDFSDQEELENARDEIQKAYYEENEETKDGKGKLTRNDENLYDMVIANWSFESLNILIVSLEDVFPIFEYSKLKKLNLLQVTCNAYDDDYDRIRTIFEYLRIKNVSDEFELKHFIMDCDDDRWNEDGEENLIKQKITLDTLPSIPGIIELDFSSFVIITVDSLLKFQQLKELTLSACDISCDINCLDSIDILKLFRCSLNVGNISGLNHNRRIIISNCTGVKDFSKSFKYTKYFQLDICEVDSLVDLGYYQHAERFLLTNETRGQSGIKFLLPERLSPTLKFLLLNKVESFTGPIPPNNIREIHLFDCRGVKTYQGMENIPFIELNRCPASIVELAQLNGKTIRLKDINPRVHDDYNSLVFIRSLHIQKATILKEIQLPQLKELYLRDCFICVNIFENSQNTLQELRSLHLIDCTFTPSGEMNFPNLEILEADRSFFKKNIIICPNLQKVIVTEKDLKPFVPLDVPLPNPQIQYRPTKLRSTTILRRLTEVDETKATEMYATRVMQDGLNVFLSSARMHEEISKEIGLDSETVHKLQRILENLKNRGMRKLNW
eukprot:gene8471-9166_t